MFFYLTSYIKDYLRPKFRSNYIRQSTNSREPFIVRLNYFNYSNIVNIQVVTYGTYANQFGLSALTWNKKETVS